MMITKVTFEAAAHTPLLIQSILRGTEALAGLLPMHILLKRLVAHSCARMATLGHSHPVRAVLKLGLVGSAPLVPLGLGSLSPVIKCWLISPAKNVIAECAEFTETFQALHPETEPGNRVLDLFPDHILWHLAPKMSNDWYGDYVKQLDRALLLARWDVDCIHTLSDASSLTKGALQALLAALVFQGNAKIAHIVAAGGQATTLNAKLMALKMCIATALAVGCLSLDCFTDSMVAMADLVDPSPHSGQGLSLAVCSALCQWFSEDHQCILHLWHVSSKEEWKIHHDTHKVVKATQIPLHPSHKYKQLFPD